MRRYAADQRGSPLYMVGVVSFLVTLVLPMLLVGVFLGYSRCRGETASTPTSSLPHCSPWTPPVGTSSSLHPMVVCSRASMGGRVEAMLGVTSSWATGGAARPPWGLHGGGHHAREEVGGWPRGG